MNKIIILLVIVLAGLGFYVFKQGSSQDMGLDTPPSSVPDEAAPVATTTPKQPVVDKTKTVLGTSIDGREITAYHYGEGSKELLFVGGIHGGYSANTALVARELMDHLASNPSAVPAGLKLTVVPVLNPDGLAKVVSDPDVAFSPSEITAGTAERVAARFNSREVDLNRNFACDWQATGKWQSRSVSGGSAEFSEPESQAIRDYVLASKPVAVVVWYSAAGGVFASSCHNESSATVAESRALTTLFAKASGYRAHEEFDYYEITGDLTNWLSREGVPAISVLLSDHTSSEWSKNKSGIEALIKHYAQ